MRVHDSDVLADDNVSDASRNRYSSDIVLAMYLHAEWGDLLAPDAPPMPALGDVAGPGSYYRQAAKLISGWLDAERVVVSEACDVGAGTGRLVREISLRQPVDGVRLTALEPSPAFCAWARSLLLGAPFAGPVPLPGTALTPRQVHVPGARRPAPIESVRVIEADAEALLDSAETFDLVTCMNVLDRVPSPGRMLDALARLVKEAGMLVVACPFDWQREFSSIREEWFYDLRKALDPFVWHIVGVAELPYTFVQYDRRVNLYASQLVAAIRR